MIHNTLNERAQLENMGGGARMCGSEMFNDASGWEVGLLTGTARTLVDQ